MGRSLFVTYESQCEFVQEADNLVIAKIMYDLGKPISPLRDLTSVYYNKDCRFFIEALENLFDSKTGLTENQQEYLRLSEEESFELKLDWDLVQQWEELKKLCLCVHPNWLEDIVSQENDCLKTVRHMFGDYSDIELRTELTSTGLRIEVDGYQGLFSSFLERYVDFFKSFTQTVKHWDQQIKQEVIKREDIENNAQRNRTGTNNYHSEGRWVASSHRAAG